MICVFVVRLWYKIFSWRGSYGVMLFYEYFHCNKQYKKKQISVDRLWVLHKKGTARDPRECADASNVATRGRSDAFGSYFWKKLAVIKGCTFFFFFFFNSVYILTNENGTAYSEISLLFWYSIIISNIKRFKRVVTFTLSQWVASDVYQINAYHCS